MNGSVRAGVADPVAVDAIVAVGVPAAADAAGAELLAAGGVVVAGGLAEGAGALVVVDGGAPAAVVVELANGSVYWLSPADPPPAASVAAGTARTSAPRTSMHVTM